MRAATLLCAASLALTTNADCLWLKDKSPLQHPASEATCKADFLGKSSSGWEGPESCLGDHCLYWNSNFNGGDGIAIITAPENAREIAAFSETFVVAPRGEDGEDDLPYYVAEVPGKGNGMIARRKIARGENVLVQPAVLMVQTEAYRSYSADLSVMHANGFLAGALEKVSGRAREAFLAQHGHDLFTKLDKNGFTVFTNKSQSSQHIGVFPHVSRINHDCRPSVSYRLNNITHTTTAVRDILPGEELSISYVDLMIPREERRERLRDWGFECTCRQCMLNELESAASDATLERIQRLEEELDSPNSTSVTAETGAELVRLYESERLDIYLGPAYTRAALNFGLFGDAERAVEYASKAIAALEQQYGPDAGDLPSMRKLQADPQAHWTWTLRKRPVLQVPIPEAGL